MLEVVSCQPVRACSSRSRYVSTAPRLGHPCRGADRPLREAPCKAWETCMQRDPTIIGRTNVMAETFAGVINSFVEAISWKTMVRPRASVVAPYDKAHTELCRALLSSPSHSSSSSPIRRFGTSGAKSSRILRLIPILLTPSLAHGRRVPSIPTPNSMLLGRPCQEPRPKA